jgi:hypothetical protein
MKYKIFFLSFVISIFILLFISLFFYFIATSNPTKLSFIENFLPNNLKFLVKEKVCKYQYYVPEFHNETIFPQTQFVKLDYKETKINNLESRKSYFADRKKNGEKATPFYIESIENKNILVSAGGTTLLYKTLDFIDNKNSKSLEIGNNLPDNITVDDTLIYENKLFISFRDRNKSCNNREIYFADLNFEYLKFREFYSHGSNGNCKSGVFGGRLAIYNDKGSPSIIVSTKFPKNDNYPLLKNYNEDRELIILLIDIKTKKSRPISAGHRNPQGLYVNNENVILSTEHGPRGGDEINKIIEGKNYGWPTSSYGENYGSKDKNFSYKKNHSQFKFEEPIYAFVPSIGISQIIKVPEEFSSKWKNNYLITSLRGLSLYRVQLDDKFSRIITMEKIRIGKRIRDISYNKKYNSFIVALENGEGSVGFISVKPTN